LGDYTEIDGQYRVRVEAAIEAKYTEAAKGSVTFTHKTWDYINKIRDKAYPDYSVVGWFHTHPGFGIFLSSYDKFIQQNFFNLPWQVAYVIDPLSGQHGFFGWCNNKIEKAPFNSVVSPHPEPAPTVLTEKESAFAFGRLATVASILVLSFAGGYLLFQTRKKTKPFKNLNQQLLRWIVKLPKCRPSWCF